LEKTDARTYGEIERLFEEYTKEVEELHEKGILKEKTMVTYITYAQYFVRWVKGDFEPGAKNKGY
jgi:hypothetical protein